MERKYWYIQLHRDKEKNPDWYKEDGFESGIDAVRYYVEEAGVVGFDPWGDIGIGNISAFVDARKGDGVFTWYTEGIKRYQALMEFVEDEVYYDPDDFEGREEVLNKLLEKAGDRAKPEKRPERVWFPLFRKVKVIKTWNEKYVDYSPQGTIGQINKKEVIERFEEVLNAKKFRGDS